jgi:hypothetical protein
VHVLCLSLLLLNSSWNLCWGFPQLIFSAYQVVRVDVCTNMHAVVFACPVVHL